VARTQNVKRDLLFSLAIAVVLGAGIAAYVMHSMPSKRDLQTSYIEPKSQAPRAPQYLELAGAVMTRFTDALAAKRFDDAYALMAEPYRDHASVETFRASCAASPFLAQAERATVFSTVRTWSGGAVQEPYTLEGRGVITGHAGSINARITFLVSGGDLRILVLVLAGVPVLNGVTAPAR
jgi:hypothetical protein